MKIDVMQDDRGLQSCLAAANLKKEWYEPFVAFHKIETLDDFVFMIQSSDTDKTVLEMAQAVKETKDNRVALARLKAAYESGTQAIRLASSVTSKSSDAVDEPLPESTAATISKDFFARFGIEIDAALEPADTVRARFYREFRKNTMTVIEIRKVKNMLTQSGPKIQESVNLPGGLKLEFDRDSVPEINSTVSYYWGLRVLAYGWAWAGNFKQRDPDGVDRFFLSLGESQHYADECLRATMEHGGGSLLWMSKNGTLTRGKMASFIRRGWSGGQSLKQALHETHLEWRAPASFQLRELDSPAKRKPPEPEAPPPPVKRAREVKSDGFKTVSMIRGGKKLCKKYNDGRGCGNRSCSDLHVCDVKLDSGKPCLSKDHNRLGHPRGE